MKALLAIIVVAFLLWAAFINSRHSARERLSITLATNSGQITQSQVIEMWWRFLPKPFDIELHVRGRALSFNLGHSGYLVAALGTQGPGVDGKAADVPFALATAVMGRPTNHFTKNVYAAIEAFRGKANIDAAYLPQFIWFPDPEDPWHAYLLTADQLNQIEPNIRVVAADFTATSLAPQTQYSPQPPWYKELQQRQHVPSPTSIPYTATQIEGY